MFTKGMKPTKGFTGKKHIPYAKMMISEGNKRAHKRGRIQRKGGVVA